MFKSDLLFLNLTGHKESYCCACKLHEGMRGNGVTAPLILKLGYKYGRSALLPLCRSMFLHRPYEQCVDSCVGPSEVWILSCKYDYRPRESRTTSTGLSSL